MGRLTFGESIYLLLMGEIPSPGIGRLMEAMLVLTSITARRRRRSPRRAQHSDDGCPAARVRGCGPARIRAASRGRYRDVHAVPRYWSRVRAERLDLWGGSRRASGAAEPRGRRTAPRVRPPLSHSRCTGRASPFQIALELEVEGHHIQVIRAVEMVMVEHPRLARARDSGQHRWRDCRCLRKKPRHSAGDCGRALRHLASPWDCCARREEDACARNRCGRSIPGITATTARPNVDSRETPEVVDRRDPCPSETARRARGEVRPPSQKAQVSAAVASAKAEDPGRHRDRGTTAVEGSLFQHRRLEPWREQVDKAQGDQIGRCRNREDGRSCRSPSAVSGDLGDSIPPTRPPCRRTPRRSRPPSAGTCPTRA